MARGFESKSVAEQQEEAERRREAKSTVAAHASARRRTLELARADLLNRLQTAPERQKDMLRQALAVVEDQLRDS